MKKNKVLIFIAAIITVVLVFVIFNVATNKKDISTNMAITTNTEDKGTNYWDSVDMYEGGESQISETTASVSNKDTTNKNKEKATKKKDNIKKESETYPGEEDGWSPIVSPDDLEK